MSTAAKMRSSGSVVFTARNRSVKFAHVFQQGQHDGALGAEQIVWRGEAHPGAIGERPHGQAGIAGFADQFSRSLDDAMTTLPPWPPPVALKWALFEPGDPHKATPAAHHRPKSHSLRQVAMSTT